MADIKITRVRDVMRTQFARVDGMDNIATALTRMQEADVSCLIVDKRNDDDEYGLLLVSDIARKVLAPDRPTERVNVYEVMAKPVVSVDPEMNIRYCARLFDRFDLSQAPVIDDGNVVGVVSFVDLVLKGMVAVD